ncbi:MAG: ABC transporter ATP-binding protein [Balneolaceae bacterium]|nr:ABC transporter ATP-binding protein [Balneolaceae bacterium]
MIDLIKKLKILLPARDGVKLILLFFLMVIAAFMEVLGIGVIPAFIAVVANPDKVLGIEKLQPIWNRLDISTSADLLVYGSVALISVFIIKNIYMVWYKYVESKFTWSRYAHISSKLFELYMQAPFTFHLSRNTSELLRNITEEARNLIYNVFTSFLKLSMEVVMITSIFIFLVIVEPLITVIIFVLLGGFGGIFLKLIRKKTRNYGKTAQNDRKMLIQSVNEGLGGFKEARVLNREQWFVHRFKNHVKSFIKAQTFQQVAQASAKPFIESIAVVGMFGITLLLYMQGRPISAVIPILSLFGVATIRLMPSVKMVVTLVNTIRYYSYTVDPIFNDTNFLRGIQNKKKSRFKTDTELSEPLHIEKAICFDQVSYYYPDTDEPAIDNLSLNIDKGAAIGFVGASGAGKTTLINLVLGLLSPQKGKIYVNDEDIEENLSAWQRSIGYIPQFIYLSDDTFRRNIAYGLPDEEIDNEKLEKAIEAAQLTSVLKELPKGMNTLLGEGGIRLSGGQRQRIGIARALYHDPDVIVMDEGTSALDNITEKFIINAIERLKGKRTIIMIAHRLTTVENCDILYFMINGKIIDSGRYDELIDKNKDFRKMALS